MIGFDMYPMVLLAIAGNIVAGLKNTAHEKGIDLLIDIDTRLDKKLIGDPTRTGQVIKNLVHNSIKFTREGFVRLSVQVTALTTGEATITLQGIHSSIC